MLPGQVNQNPAQQEGKYGLATEEPHILGNVLHDGIAGTGPPHQSLEDVNEHGEGSWRGQQRARYSPGSIAHLESRAIETVGRPRLCPAGFRLSASVADCTAINMAGKISTLCYTSCDQHAPYLDY